MSAQLELLAGFDPSNLQVDPMHGDDLPAVLAIERAIYPFPWTEGNFVDSLRSAYQAWVFRLKRLPRVRPGTNTAATVAGYAVLMPALDEVHLLNLSVTQTLQGQGLGQAMLDWLIDDAAARSAKSMILEVRPSNARAIRLYQRSGFRRIGIRRRYYPSFENTREDAIVMRRSVDG